MIARFQAPSLTFDVRTFGERRRDERRTNAGHPNDERQISLNRGASPLGLPHTLSPAFAKATAGKREIPFTVGPLSWPP
jgi:hypothetical protein